MQYLIGTDEAGLRAELGTAGHLGHGLAGARRRAGRRSVRTARSGRDAGDRAGRPSCRRQRCFANRDGRLEGSLSAGQGIAVISSAGCGRPWAC